jgi:flagellar hook-associated protein 3 FlgL
MAMRISTAQMLSYEAMSSRQTQLSKTQLQLSSGKKILSAADDPAVAVRALDLEGTIAKTNQYQSNISTVRGRLITEESALGASVDILARIRTLTLQAGGGSLSNNDRLGLKLNVDQAIQELANVANTKSSYGEYIFSGDLSNVPPFAIDSVTGAYGYQGGSVQRVVQISPTRQIADADLGFNVFENLNSSSLAANGTRSIFNTLKELSNTLGGTFNATPGQITGSRLLPFGLDYSAAATTFDLVANPGPVTASIDLTGKNLADVPAIVTEINNQLTAGGFNTDIQARSNGNRIEFVSVATGAASSIEINNPTGTFLTDAGFVSGQNKAGVDAVAPPVPSLVKSVITDLDAALSSVSLARASAGVRLNALDNQEAQNGQFILDSQVTLSETQDLDYAEAASRFQLQSTALQAAQQAYVKIKDLSLFKYL